MDRVMSAAMWLLFLGLHAITLNELAEAGIIPADAVPAIGGLLSMVLLIAIAYAAMDVSEPASKALDSKANWGLAAGAVILFAGMGLQASSAYPAASTTIQQNIVGVGVACGFLVAIKPLFATDTVSEYAEALDTAWRSE
jgi:hypothetical protein